MAGRLSGQGPVLVAGLGRAGRAAVDALLDAGSFQVSAWDRTDSRELRRLARRLRARGVAVTLGGHGASALDATGPGALVVKSPGIAMDTPLLQEARTRGHYVIDELELGLRRCPEPMLGVTGTNGKTTTSHLCATALSGCGYDTELAGNTEFGPPLSAVRGGGWVVCEVSSFQLDASPSFRPEVAVLTNLTPDHLDRHGSMAAYGAAKRSMFVAGDATAGTSVINVDDCFGRELAREVRAAGGRVLGYGTDVLAEVQILDARWTIAEATISLRTPRGPVALTTGLPGRHNAFNVTAALAVGEALGLPVERVTAALSAASAPPGRWQRIEEGQPFDVIVDYAHTPDGLVGLLEAVRGGLAGRPHAQVRTVFGPVGVHDRRKDHASGQAVGALSDRLIVTSGSAGVPSRLVRIADVKAGTPHPDRVEVELDRRAAIESAIGAAQPGDVVVLAGLGHLRRQLLDGYTRHPHNDADAAREALREGSLAWS